MCTDESSESPNELLVLKLESSKGIDWSSTIDNRKA